MTEKHSNTAERTRRRIARGTGSSQPSAGPSESKDFSTVERELAESVFFAGRSLPLHPYFRRD